jgi:hypothetical protein
MSLRDGTKKMSKSDPSEQSRVSLTDDADAIALKIRRAKSDSLTGVTYDPEARPEASNLLTIYAALSGRTRADVQAEFGESPFSDFKGRLAELAVERLAPIAGEMRRLMADPGHLDRVLRTGRSGPRRSRADHAGGVRAGRVPAALGMSRGGGSPDRHPGAEPRRLSFSSTRRCPARPWAPVSGRPSRRTPRDAAATMPARPPARRAPRRRPS